MTERDSQSERKDNAESISSLDAALSWVLPSILALMLGFGMLWATGELKWGPLGASVALIIAVLGGIALGMMLTNLVQPYEPWAWLVYLPGLASLVAIYAPMLMKEVFVRLHLQPFRDSEQLSLRLSLLPVLAFVWAVRLYRGRIPIRTRCAVTVTAHALVALYVAIGLLWG